MKSACDFCCTLNSTQRLKLTTRMNADYNLITLGNGIRAVHKQVPHTKVAHCAIMLDIGSRDEKGDQQGIAHFWEHMAFKGTHKRKAFHILNRLESLGGELNAYTTKEKICFYASVLDVHLEKAMELLVDITFSSIFPNKQIDKERQVILEEMSMYEDSPEDAIQDDMDAVIFKGHQLGNNILGNRESVGAFSKNDFLRFIEENLDTERIVFSSIGNLSYRKIERLVEKHLFEIPHKTFPQDRLPVNGYASTTTHVEKKILQAHCAIGTRAYSIHEPQRIPFFVLNNILGGSSMNSRLNLSIREKYGLVYAIESQYQAYTDTGLFSIFYGTEPKNLSKSIDLVFKEMDKLHKVKLGSRQLQTAKDQIKGQLAMAEENNNSIMLMMAKSLLDLGRIQSLESIFGKIDAITTSELQELARDIFGKDRMSMLVYDPTS